MTTEPRDRRSGPTNSLADVGGVRVGHHTAVGDGWLSGTTVVLLGEDGAVAGVDVRGGGPATRETDLLDPSAAVERVHALVLTGGSAFGLAAADGVMARLEARGVGVQVVQPAGPDGVAPPQVTVPIVPTAALFDIGRGGVAANRPDASFGAAAHDAAMAADPGDPVASGNVGAGAGAVAGGLRGGIGTASVQLIDGTTVAALVACNAAGSTVDPTTGELAGARVGLTGEFDHLRPPAAAEIEAHLAATQGDVSLNTALAIVATDATLSKAHATKLAAVGQDGLARAIRPAHSMIDGDTVFGAATGARPAPDFARLQAILAAGADTISRATAHAMLAATSTSTPAGSWHSYRDRFPSAVGRPSASAAPTQEDAT